MNTTYAFLFVIFTYRNFYFRMWAGSDADIAMRTIDIDTGILNLSMMSHLFNTFPQVCVCLFI